jgi:glycosyltransferase involved in cell wall biosynthesis
MYPISLVVITKNEEAHIESCIRSVPWASDIVVLDSESQDQTASLAQNLGARVFIEKFRGFKEQKQRVTELAKFDWVLSLDADERLSPALQQELKEFFSNFDFAEAKMAANYTHTSLSGPIDGLTFPRRSWFLGRWINFGGWYPDYQLRFFNRKKAQWIGDQVHEKISSIEGRNGLTIHRMKSEIEHYVFESISDQVITNDKYSTLGAKALQNQNVKFSLARLILKPISKFIECYLLKQGFRDGLPGFIIAVSAAYSMFLKQAKLWELEK